MSALEIEYKFWCHDRTERTFDVRLDPESLEQTAPEQESLPSWTALQFHQCPNCPLDASEHPHCPVAMNLVQLVQGISGLRSHDEVEVEVREPERTVSKKTTAQRGISSLLGLIMATSPCPHTAYLRPMARFHLPLANEEETVYRATSMYLLAQYFAYRDGRAPDLALKGLTDIYRNLQIINQAMAKRLRHASEQDAAVNAVVLLDLLAKTLPYAIMDSLNEVRNLFSSYLE